MTEEVFFEIKQKFLRDIPHPKLILKQIERLGVHSAEQIELADFESPDSLTDFLDKYINELLTLKLKIANAVSQTNLSDQLLILYSWQMQLIKQLDNIYPEDCTIDDEAIKQSEPFDAYACLKEIREMDVHENQIKDYLCKQFKKGADGCGELAKSVVRARKIVSYGR